MRTSLALVICALLFAPSLLSAQALYRCGSTFSQTPCAPDAQQSKLPAMAVPKQADGMHGDALCSFEGPRRLGLPDPASVRTDHVVKQESEVIQYAGKPIVARKYRITVSTLNFNGVYVDSQTFDCYLSEDERRVLNIQRPGRQARR